MLKASLSNFSEISKEATGKANSQDISNKKMLLAENLSPDQIQQMLEFEAELGTELDSQLDLTQSTKSSKSSVINHQNLQMNPDSLASLINQGNLQEKSFDSSQPGSLKDQAAVLVAAADFAGAQSLNDVRKHSEQSGKVYSPELGSSALGKNNQLFTHLDSPVLHSSRLSLEDEQVLTQSIHQKLGEEHFSFPKKNIDENELFKTKGQKNLVDNNQQSSKFLDGEEFLNLKNMSLKKIQPKSYPVTDSDKVTKQMSLDLGSSQIKPEQGIMDSGMIESGPVKSQDFILGLASAHKVAETAAPEKNLKVFDLSNINATNTNEIISEITDYVVQARTAKEPTVNLRVSHDELGMIDITVAKSGSMNENIAVNIATHSSDGRTFFQSNSKDLFHHLSNVGINVTDIKVETASASGKENFDFNSQSGKDQQSGQKQFGSEQNQKRHESDRRQELWKIFNKEAA